MDQRTKKAIATTLVMMLGVFGNSGCQTYPDYPDVLWACDNRRSPAEPQCMDVDRGPAAMTVSLYESIDGPLIFRIRDYGAGIKVRILEVEGRWMKIEMTTGQVGFVNLDEPATTTSALH